MSVTSTYCAMYLFVHIYSSLSLINMNKVFIQTINHSQSWPPCLHLMDETPSSCRINIQFTLFVITVLFEIYLSKHVLSNNALQYSLAAFNYWSDFVWIIHLFLYYIAFHKIISAFVTCFVWYVLYLYSLKHNQVI